VTVNAGTLALLRGGSIRSATFASGNAGQVALNVNGALIIDGTNFGHFINGVSSEATDSSSGSAGLVQVNAGSVSVRAGGFINSNTRGTGTGGSVVVTTPGALLLDGHGSGSTEIGASALGTRSGDAGTVTVHAGAVTVQGGASIDSFTNGLGRGGSVVVKTPGALLLDGQGVGPTQIVASAQGAQSGNAGTITITITITINAGAVTLLRAGAISSQTNAAGNAGEVALTVKGALTIDGANDGGFATAVSSEASTQSSGSAGTIQVNAGSVSVLGGFISSGTLGTGAGGSVLVTTPGALLVDSQGIRGSTIAAASLEAQSGNAGAVTVDAGAVTVQGGATIASATNGSGLGGEVTVRASALTLLSGGEILSSTFGSGNAGKVALKVGGAFTIDSANNGGFATGVSSAAAAGGSGSAGTVQVNAGSISVQSGGQITSSSAGPGRGGNVGVAASSAIRLDGPTPQITATSTGAGDAGSITVAAPWVDLRNGASISTGAQAANGGNITIEPGDLLHLQRSSTTTSVNSAFGNGGNIIVDPRLVVLDRSLIVANAVGGDGGNVLVRADQLVPSFDSAITATSQRAVSGAIFITAQPLNLNGSLVVLAGELRSAAALLREGCAARGAGPRSSLLMDGRGGQRQALETTVPALYFAHRPVHDVEFTAPEAAAVPVRSSIGLSSPCG